MSGGNFWGTVIGAVAGYFLGPAGAGLMSATAGVTTGAMAGNALIDQPAAQKEQQEALKAMYQSAADSAKMPGASTGTTTTNSTSVQAPTTAPTAGTPAVVNAGGDAARRAAVGGGMNLAGMGAGGLTEPANTTRTPMKTLLGA
ncbi:MAG: hypothetical protein ACRDAJ_06945 [Serratia fonticola]